MGKNAKTQRQEQMREYQERLRREEEEKKKKEQQVFIWAMIAVFALAVIVAAVVIIGAVGNGKESVTTPPATTQAPTLLYPDAPKMEELDFSTVEDFTRFELTENETDYVLINVSYKNEGGLTCTEDIVVRLFDEVAPITVENFKGLVKDHFYDGLIFHRVIEDFMIQGGGVQQDGSEKEPAKTIKGEFAANGYNNHLQHVRGVISMARTDVMDSASSQFYIVQKDSVHLDEKYAGFGYTVYGMDTVDAIARQDTDLNDKPVQPVVINYVRFVKLNAVEEVSWNHDSTDQ